MIGFILLCPPEHSPAIADSAPSSDRTSLFRWLVLWAAVFTLAVVSTARGQERGNDFETAEALRRHAQYEQAIGRYEQALRGPSEHRIGAFAGLGDCYEHAGQAAPAQAYYQKATAQSPASALEYKSRGDAFIDLKLYQRALIDLDQAIRLDPAQASAYCSRGLALLRSREYERAFADFERATQLDSSLTQAYLFRGIGRRELAEFRGAIDDFTAAIRIDPEDAWAYYQRGLTRFECKEYEDALADFDRAIQIAPTLPLLYITRGDTYWALKRPKLTLQDYESAAQLRSAWPLRSNGSGEFREVKSDRMNRPSAKGNMCSPTVERSAANATTARHGSKRRPHGKTNTIHVGPKSQLS